VPLSTQTNGSAPPSPSASESSDDPHAYEVLCPSDAGTRALLAKSAFYQAHMPPPGDRVSESLLYFCGSFPVRMAPVIAASLVRRFTDAGFNWRNKTLQSFLEVVCWTSVTYAAYSLYGDWLVALQVGTFVGALMSICDEVVLQFVRGLARVIRNQPGGSELLQRLGFDVPQNGKAPTSGREIELIKTLVFGYLGVVAVRSLWDNFHDVQFFALLSAAVGVAFVVTAEFCCLWLPTRRVGLTLQSRFTTVGQNWDEHFARSLVELLAWVGATCVYYYHSQDAMASLRVGTLVAVAVCLASGLEDLPDIVSSDDDASHSSAYAYWQNQLHGDVATTLAKGMVKVQDAVYAMGAAVQGEAMNMYENWSQ
jgi:hypothetical protein